MHKNSKRRSSSLNPVRVSAYEREEKSSSRNDPRRTQISKTKGSTQVDGSHIPRPRIRSSSSDRTSIRRSNLKPLGRTPLGQTHHSVQPMRVSNATTPLHTAVTPRVSSVRPHLDLPSGSRHRSPSADRASTFGASGPRKDCRPLADKSYQNSMLTTVDRYFYEIQQTNLLNPSGSLKPITLKMFVEATNCLLKLLNVKQDLTMGNYIDELPKVAKKLHYPGVVTKSWLKTANTMHSWPHVLGWLSWLAEVCEAKEKAEDVFSVDKIPFVACDPDEETHRGTILTLFSSYRAWNDEKLDEEAALMEKRVGELIMSNGDIAKLIEEEESLLSKERERAKLLGDQEIEIDEALNACKKIMENLKLADAREAEDIIAIEESEKRVIIETKNSNEICNRIVDQLKLETEQHRKIITMNEKQPMTVERRNEITKECSSLENHIRQLEKCIQEMEQEIYALDLKFANCNKNLLKTIYAYNKDIIVNLRGDLGIDLESLKIPETNFLSSDFMDTLRIKSTSMMNIKETIKEKLCDTETAIATNNNELILMEENLRILRQSNQDYRTMAEDCKRSTQEIERDAKKMETELRGDIMRIEKEIADLRQSVPDVETAAKELTEAQEKFRAVIQRSEFVSERMKLFFDKFYGIIGHHRNELNVILQKHLDNPRAQHENSDDAEKS